jgi:hypothetical protein
MRSTYILFRSAVTALAVIAAVSFWPMCQSALAKGAAHHDSLLASVSGTWSGTSTCVGNRPACKNEIVVYRFIPIDGHPNQLRLYADKIIEGKRLPMGALVLDLNESARTLRGEFTRGHTHGEWSFAVKGDAMTGQLVILPERSIGRDVKVRKVKESEVPDAPPLSDYEE